MATRFSKDENQSSRASLTAEDIVTVGIVGDGRANRSDGQYGR
jgi:hypothetical protein